MNAPEDNAVEFDSKSNSEYQNCSKGQQCPPKWDSEDKERLLVTFAELPRDESEQIEW